MLRLVNMNVETQNKLRKIASRSRDGVARTRAQILSQMAYGRRLADAADYANVSAQCARKTVRAFNALGMISSPPSQGGGAPFKLGSPSVKIWPSLFEKTLNHMGFRGQHGRLKRFIKQQFL